MSMRNKACCRAGVQDLSPQLQHQWRLMSAEANQRASGLPRHSWAQVPGWGPAGGGICGGCWWRRCARSPSQDWAALRRGTQLCVCVCDVLVCTCVYLCVSVHPCMHRRKHVHTCPFVCLCAHMCAHLPIYTFCTSVYLCVSVCTCACVHLCARVHICASVFVCTCVNIHVCLFVSMSVCVCVHVVCTCMCTCLCEWTGKAEAEMGGMQSRVETL